MIKKFENTGSCTYVVSDLNEEEIFATFYAKEMQKPNQKRFRVEKAMKRKGDIYFC